MVVHTKCVDRPSREGAVPVKKLLDRSAFVRATRVVACVAVELGISEGEAVLGSIKKQAKFRRTQGRAHSWVQSHCCDISQISPDGQRAQDLLPQIVVEHSVTAIFSFETKKFFRTLLRMMSEFLRVVIVKSVGSERILGQEFAKVANPAVDVSRQRRITALQKVSAVGGCATSLLAKVLRRLVARTIHRCLWL